MDSAIHRLRPYCIVYLSPFVLSLRGQDRLRVLPEPAAWSSLKLRADVVVADSISQCRERGEISKAIAVGCLKEEKIVELGQIIDTCKGKNQVPRAKARASENQITVADLTGVAVQDIQIATAACRAADNSYGDAAK